jgi:hypothetical protein
VDGVRLALQTTLGDRYRVRTTDGGMAIGPWRLTRVRKEARHYRAGLFALLMNPRVSC